MLLAEDSPDDVLLVRLGFRKGQGKYADRAKFPIPGILLLDLKLPRLNGFDVLTWIRQRPEWKCLPVIVLTTSHFGKDIEQAYDLGANSFLSKPTDLNEWMSAVRQMIRFWLFESSLPEPGPFVPAPQAPPHAQPIVPPGYIPRSSRRPPRAKPAKRRAHR